MFKKKIFLYFLVALSVFSFNLMTVKAYMSNTSSPVINRFSVASFYTDTYIYNYVANNGTVTKLGEKVITKAAGDTVNIDNPDIDVSQYILDSITINGTESYNIGDTYTQPNNDLTIVYTYRDKRTYNVSYSGSTNNYTHTGGNTVLEGNTYTTRISISNNGLSLSSITIRMNNIPLTEGVDYTYSQPSNRNYDITIPNVSGNIQIDIQLRQGGGGGPCLAEGTKVLLWNGTTKNIEDIKYNDLLKVWNHDTGSFGYEYAGWIEKEGTTNEYTKVTFSDGSELKVIGNHSVFSKRLNKYVDVNSDDLKVGDKVVSIKNGISYVKVTSIEKVQEEINYYHVISTRYFNLITNNILTTYEIYNNVSNFMGFGNNLKWQNTEIVRSDMFTYDDFTYLDKYLFKVFRLEETKYLLNTGLVTQEQFNDLYNNYLMDNDKKVIPPKNDEGKYLWMVTTSDDNNPDDISHQMVEDSTYIVPTPNNNNNFKYWYNHSDNKTYQPGDTIIVDSSMYLEAIYD